MRHWRFVFCVAVVLLATSARSGEDDVLVPEGEPEAVLSGLVWEPMGAVTVMAFSPDGRTLATSGEDRVVRLWEVGSGREVRRLSEHVTEVGSMAFSPDGRTLAAGGKDGTVRLWEVGSGRELRKLEGHTGWVLSVVFSPDGRILATGGQDTVVRMWEVGSGRGLWKLEGHTDWVSTVAFLREGGMLATAGRDETVRLWEVSSGRLLGKYVSHEEVESLSFSPDGNTWATQWQDGSVGLLEEGSARAARKLEGLVRGAAPMAFSPDGRILVTGGEDGVVRLWDVGSGRQVRKLEGHTNGVRAVAFSPDGRTLATGGDDRVVRLWEVGSGREVRRLEGHMNWVPSVAFSPDARTLAAGGEDGTVRLWEADGGWQVGRLEGHTGWVESMVFSPDGRTLATGGEDGTVRLWTAEGGRQLHLLAGHSDSVESVAFSPDGRMLATGSKDGTARLWEVGSGRMVLALRGHAGWVLSVAFSPDGRTLATGGEDGTVRLWGVDSGGEVRKLEGHASWVLSVAFSPDGRTLASGGKDKWVRLWEVGSGRQVRGLEGLTGWVRSVAFSPDGRTLATGGQDRMVRLWEVGSGREVRRLEGFTNWVWSIAFSRDGRTLATSEGTGTVRLWSAGTGHPSATIRMGGRLNWMSYRPGQDVLRRDDGRFLQRQRDDGTLAPVLPPRAQKASELSASVTSSASPGDCGEIGEMALRVSNSSSAGRAYWIRVEPVELPPGLVLLPPPAVLRLEPGGEVELRVGLSYLRPEGSPVPRNTRVRLKVLHAHGEGPTLEIPIRIRAPDVEVVGEPRVEGENLTVTIKNTGDQSSGALLLTGLFDAEGVVARASPQQKLEDLPPGEARTLALAIPSEMLGARSFSLALTTRFERWPRTSARTFENVKVPPPYTLYGALMMGAMLMGAVVYYARVYRNPVVVQTTASPSVLRRYSLSELRAADLALRRARCRDSTVIAAGIPLIRWERVLRGAGTATAAVESFAEAIGGRLGAPLASTAWGLSLPLLRLRFTQETAVVVVDGSRLESGEAERHMADVFQDGKGPGQVLVLDRTVAQNAVQVLHHVPHVRAVVLTVERLRDLLVAEEPVRLLEAIITEQVAVSELSPYQVAGAVKNESFFFGRERELRDIVERSFRNFLLVGQRQMGKSSLLMAVKRRLEARAGLDVHYVELADADLHRHLARHRKLMAVDGTAPPRFEDVAAGEPSRPRVWLIDEVDDFVTTDAKAGYPLVRVMRALAEEGRAYFILAGFWELYRAVVLDEKQPLRNFGEHRRLEPLEPRAAVALVMEPMAALGLTWDAPSTTEYLLERAGRRANLLVLACKGLVETLAQDTRTLTREHLERVLREDRDLRDQCRRWRGDSPLHRAVVRQALLLGHPTREEVRVALKARGADVSASDFDEAMDHRELSYVLVPDADGRLSCPVPLMRGYIESERGLEQGLSEDLEDLRRGLIAVPPPAA